MLKIPEQYIIHQTQYWTINHRINTYLPGYLMISSKQSTHTLAGLSTKALNELGILQAKVDRLLRDIVNPPIIYTSRYGHSPKLPIHFHIIPVYQWVIDLFWQDERYRCLQQFGNNAPETLTDGAELTLFIWREFCESDMPPPIQGMTIDDMICVLKKQFAA